MGTTTILTAASIITMDPRRPRAEAVGFDTDSGRILAVGSVRECRSAAPGAEEVDLGDTVLMPGFIDPHSHPILSGTSTQEPAHWIAPYVGYPTWADVTTFMEQLDAKTEAGLPLVLTGLDRMLHGAPNLSRTDLDELLPDRPVVIVDNSGHEIYFNTALIRMLGWPDLKPPADPVGGNFGRNEDGSSDGRARELPTVMMVVPRVLEKIVDHPLMQAARFYKLMASHGITATTDHTYDSSTREGYAALAGVPDSPLRISLYHVSFAEDAGEPLGLDVPREMVEKVGIKLWGDGSPWIGNVALSFPYQDCPTVRDAGIPIGPAGDANMNYTRTELDQILDTYAPQGWQMAFHVNGDVALDVVLDAYERALVKHDLLGTDHRWRIEHCGAGRPDQFRRAAGLGVTPSLAPFHFIYWGDLLDGTLFDSEIGSPWQPFKGAFDAGMRPSFHNDGSVSPPIPLLNVQTAITRQTISGKVHSPEQAISLDDALKAVTINAAWQMRRDDDIGSVEPGKLADFVELSKDPYLADPTRLVDQVSVLGTWLSGRKIDLGGFLGQVAAIPVPASGH
jgi:predicted amidohydrolase YtcJ